MNFTLRFATLSVAATAIAAAATYKVSIPVDVLLDGHELNAGDYRVNVDNDTAMLQKGKQKVESKVRTQTADRKFDTTVVRYIQTEGRYRLAEISIGGSKTKLVFENPKEANGGL